MQHGRRPQRRSPRPIRKRLSERTAWHPPTSQRPLPRPETQLTSNFPKIAGQASFARFDTGLRIDSDWVRACAFFRSYSGGKDFRRSRHDLCRPAFTASLELEDLAEDARRDNRQRIDLQVRL